MPPPSPRPTQRRDTDPVDRDELKAIYDIHANTALCGLVAALRRHLQDINPNRLFAVVILPCRTPHPPKSPCGSSRHSSPPGCRSRTTSPTRGAGGSTSTSQTGNACGSCTSAGCTRSLRCRQSRGPRQAPGGRNGPPHNRGVTPSTSHRTMAWRTWKAGQPPTGGATSGTWWSETHQGRRRRARDPHNAQMTPAPSP